MLTSLYLDSTHSRYTQMALEHPEQIKKIFIRDITTERLKKLAAKAPAARTLSFSSLISTKTRLFNRRGSSGATNSPSIDDSSMSDKMLGDGGDNAEEDVQTTASPDELSDNELEATAEGAQATDSPKVESNDQNSPRQPRRFTANLRAMSASFLMLKRSPGDDRNKKHDGRGSNSQDNVQDARTHESQAEQLTSNSPEGTSDTQHDKSDQVKKDNADEHGRFQRHVVVQQHHYQSKVTVGTQFQSSVESTYTSVSSFSSPLPISPMTPLSGGSGSKPSSPVSSRFPTANGAHEPSGRDTPAAPEVTQPPTSPPMMPSQTCLISPSSTISNAKTPLENWYERVEKCKQQLPSGMLTLFESAKELEECHIVQDLFNEHTDVHRVNKQEDEQKQEQKREHGQDQKREREQQEKEQEQEIKGDVGDRVKELNAKGSLLPERRHLIPSQSVTSLPVPPPAPLPIPLCGQV